MKILNLDKLQRAPDRELHFKGKVHKILPVSVEHFVDTTKMVQDIIEKGMDPVDQLNTAVAMIMKLVPTLTREELMSVEAETLNIIANFVRGKDVDGQEEVPVEGAEAGN